MGDPKKSKKKYQTPTHPWSKNAIEEERILKKEFGLQIKKEILIAQSFLKKYKNLAKKLIASKTVQGEREKAQILNKLISFGILAAGSSLDSILDLTIRDVLNRRLQSIVYQKGLARSMKQARQFITHRHILVNGKEITAPSFMLDLEGEANLSFKLTSSLFDEEHPERKIEVKSEEGNINNMENEKKELSEEESVGSEE